MPLDALEFILFLRNVPQFVADAEKASAAVGGVGKSAETSGTAAGRGWKGMLKWAAGASLIYGGVKFLRDANKATADLAKGTYALQTQTGMDTERSSEWIALTKERGISTRQLSTSIATLSRQIDKSALGTSTETQKVAALRKQIDAVAAAGGKDAPKQLAKLSSAIASAQSSGEKARLTLNRLGIPLDAIRKGRTGDVLLTIADAFQKMRDPSERAALAQQLLGRTGQQLLPVLSKGREAVLKMLDAQKASGHYLTSSQLKAEQQQIAQQRELSKAFEGLKTQTSLALLPVMTGFAKVLLVVAKALEPVTSNAKALRVVIVTLVVALVAWRVAIIASTVATLSQTAATEGWTVAQWALNLAMDANVIGIVVIAIIGLIAVTLIVIKHFGTFKRIAEEAWQALLAGAEFVWNWLKKNWPYVLGVLTGPFGLAVVLIIKHFKTIKQFLVGFVNDVRGLFDRLINYVKGIPGKLIGSLKKIPGGGAVLKAAGTVGGLAGHLGLQAGGTVMRGGNWLVGEQGPEVLNLPSGSSVVPLTPTQQQVAMGGLGVGTIEVPVYLDSQVLARAVAQVGANTMARR